jgi:hypothetical protein
METEQITMQDQYQPSIRPEIILVSHLVQRNIFWMQAAFHGMTSVGLLGFYWPPPSNYPRLKLRQLIWACDPIGSLLMTVGVTLLLLGFN